MSRDIGAGDLGRLDEPLAAGAARLGLVLAPEQRGTLLRYLALLVKWNRVYSLTAVRTPEQMLTRHLLDSLSVSRWVERGPVLDVGSGAGLPGLVLAVALPKLRFVLLDSNRKKSRFCVQAVAELELANVQVVCERLEAHSPRERYGTLLSRALGPVQGLLRDLRRVSARGARVLVMMGRRPESDDAGVAPLQECAKVLPLSVPGLDADRHLLMLDMACVEIHMADLERRG